GPAGGFAAGGGRGAAEAAGGPGAGPVRPARRGTSVARPEAQGGPDLRGDRRPPRAPGRHGQEPAVADLQAPAGADGARGRPAMIPERTGAQVDEQLALYAAREADLPTRAAIDAHVAHCPACAASLAMSQELMGLLDLRADEPARLERLRQRL